MRTMTTRVFVGLVPWLACSALLVGAPRAGAQPRDVYGTVKRPTSEVIHDQTLKQGVQQRTNYSRGSSWSSSSQPQSEVNDPRRCVSHAQQQAICGELTEIAKGRSRKPNQHEIVAEALLAGGPFYPARCFDRSYGFEARLQIWGRTCHLNDADLRVLRDPAAAAAERERLNAKRPTYVAPPPPPKPVDRPAPLQPPSPQPVAPVAKRLPVLMTTAARTTQSSRLRLRQYHEEALVQQDREWRAKIDAILARAPEMITTWAKHPTMPTTPARAFEDCKRYPGSACYAALSMARTPSEVAAAQLGVCLSDGRNCREAEIFARAAKDWASHLRIVSRRCALEHGEPCAVMAQYHLSSPAWRKEWQWPPEDRSPWAGRRAAFEACAAQGNIHEPSCEELVRAARFSLGGPGGLTVEEEALLRKQCTAGYVAEEACDQSLSLPIVKR